MKLLIAADIFPPESGGPATYAVTLANELVKQGVDVCIVSLNPNSDTSVVRCPVFAVSTRFKPLRYAHYYYLLNKHAKNVDTVYAMGPVNAGIPALWAAKKLQKKFVVKVVGDYAWEQARARNFTSDGIDEFQTKSYYGKIRRLMRLERKVVREADAIITPSEYLKKMVIGWGAKPTNVHVVHNAVECIDAPAETKPSGEKWIVSVARLLPWKGMEMLIACMPNILKIEPTARLKIIGNGPEYNRLERLVQKNKLASVVSLAGNLPRLKTLGCIKSADVFVLNSGYEGMSHVILEAQNFGVPVLASNCGGNPEIVEKTDLFEYNNAEQITQSITRVLSGDEPHASTSKNSDAAAFDAQWEKELLMIADTLRILT